MSLLRLLLWRVIQIPGYAWRKLLASEKIYFTALTVISDFSFQVKNNLTSQMMWIVIVGRVVTFFSFHGQREKSLWPSRVFSLNLWIYNLSARRHQHCLSCLDQSSANGTTPTKQSISNTSFCRRDVHLSLGSTVSPTADNSCRRIVTSPQRREMISLSTPTSRQFIHRIGD
jgi:hypothetical protein